MNSKISNFNKNIETVKKCTGCGACLNICPVNAISMEYNENGFYSPVINKDICINCGKCLKVCPSADYNFKNNKKPICYTVAANDDERKNSTSGAFFPILAKYVLNKKGYVCGVAWNKDWEAEHIIINNENDLYKLRFSKYVQAKTGNCYSQIKKLLENDNYVLFSGTPCQVAGLKKFLNKDYEKLITLDLICHGAPSPKVWQDYLKENFDTKGIIDINFRNKDNGWLRCAESINFSKIVSNRETIQPIGVYYEAFLKHRISNEACLNCKYRTVPRPADFTCGDFWNLYNTKLNDKKGLSACLLNNKKAVKIFEEIKSEFKFYKKINLGGKYKKIELDGKSRAKVERDMFFQKYREGKISTTKLLKASVGRYFDVGLLSFFNGLNYGSSLVAYAANNILENLGYSVLNIHKRVSFNYDYDKRHLSFDFAKRNYFISREYSFSEKPTELNDVCESFVLGSDTLWWWDDVCLTDNHFWLDFANSQKRKISFCTSFGFDEPNIPIQKQNEIKYLYSRFHSLSTRDESGVDILKNYFNCESEYLCDPTFIAEKDVFENLASKSDRTDKNYIVAYILDYNNEKIKAVESFAKSHNLPLIMIPQMDRSYRLEKRIKKDINIPIEDFVYLIKNANFVVTDSFHGACFSVIFEKPFVGIVNNNRGNARYKIFKEMNLQDNFIGEYEDLKDFPYEKYTDYTKARSVISEKREKAINWLKQALSKPIGNIDKTDLLYDYIFLNKEKEILKEGEINNPFKLKVLYLKYRFLANITKGSKRNHYRQRKTMYKKMILKSKYNKK